MTTASGIIGVVHLAGMPGDPRGRSFDEVFDLAMADAHALIEGGVNGIIVENFGSAPFQKGTLDDPIPPHQVAFLTRVTQAVAELSGDVSVGVNCLRNDVHSALAIAAVCGLDSVRVNVHVGAYVTDQGLIEGEAASSLRYRELLGAPTEIWADVLVKHASPLAPLEPEQAVADCELRGRADAIIVTGSGTGSPVSPELLRRVSDARRSAPVLIGSGFGPGTLDALAPWADGAIVGTYLKHDGITTNPVDPARVARLVELADGAFRRAP